MSEPTATDQFLANVFAKAEEHAPAQSRQASMTLLLREEVEDLPWITTVVVSDDCRSAAMIFRGHPSHAWELPPEWQRAFGQKMHDLRVDGRFPEMVVTLYPESMSDLRSLHAALLDRCTPTSRERLRVLRSWADHRVRDVQSVYYSLSEDRFIVLSRTPALIYPVSNVRILCSTSLTAATLVEAVPNSFISVWNPIHRRHDLVEHVAAEYRCRWCDNRHTEAEDICASCGARQQPLFFVKTGQTAESALPIAVQWWLNPDDTVWIEMIMPDPDKLRALPPQEREDVRALIGPHSRTLRHELPAGTWVRSPFGRLPPDNESRS